MRLLIINLIGLLILETCSKPAPVPAPIFSVQVFYKTQSGADLLNPQTPGYFNKDGVKVFDVSINASGAQMSTPSSVNKVDQNCNGYYVCQPDNSGLYTIQFVVRPTNELKVARIQLNSSIIETLSYQIISATPQLGYAVDKVSYKGQVIWSRGMPTPASITIVK